MKKWDPRLIRLELGKEYLLSTYYLPKTRCKFIKVTRCGYNFLNLETNKCILNRHLYPSKKIDPVGEMFFVNKKIGILETKKFNGRNGNKH